MTTFFIGNGAGTESNKAGVDSTGRLLTRGVSEDGAIDAVFNGKHYILSSGEINIAVATENAVMYLKNLENYPLYIDKISIDSDDSVSGTLDYMKVNIYQSPTGLASGSGTDVSQCNSDLSSSNTIVINSEIGASGSTVTGGVVIESFRIENPTLSREENVRYFLPKGASIAVSIEPPAANTSLDCKIELNAHLVTHL